jgi:hypothetical protein
MISDATRKCLAFAPAWPKLLPGLLLARAGPGFAFLAWYARPAGSFQRVIGFARLAFVSSAAAQIWLAGVGGVLILAPLEIVAATGPRGDIRWAAAFAFLC